MTGPVAGQRYGLLTFAGLGDGVCPRNRSQWRMVCDCGTEKTLPAIRVKTGGAKSCGCMQAAQWAVALIGRRFGRLIVLSRAPRPPEIKGSGAWWRCACDCGTECVGSTSALSRGDKRSCGCLHREAVALDVAGKKFGRLTPTDKVDSGQRGVTWRCACDCGNETKVLAAYLKDLRVTSCGCGQIDKPGFTAEVHLATAHRRRARALQAGGSFTPEQISELYRLQRGQCACCGDDLGRKFHRDHRTALANGGSNDISNIELLCPSCNLRKNAKDEIEWANENGRLL